MTASTRSNTPPVYRGENLRAVAMPLGGIGAGTVALCGDGSLRQWQLCNNVNHLAYVPHSFFAVRAQRDGQPAVARVLQSGALYQEEFAPIPCANDYVLPRECKRLLEALPGVQATEFVGEYPLAQVRYQDEALPVDVSMVAYSPFCPLDSRASGVPAVVFRLTAHNGGDRSANVQFAMTLQNFVGWDGVQEILGTECPLYGGNENHVLRLRGLTSIVMENSLLPSAHPKNGSLCLAAVHEGASARAAWRDLQEFWDDFSRDGALLDNASASASSQGNTINGALAVPLRLEAGESKTVTFVLAWYFPNRYVDWIQWFSKIDDRKSQFWLGNAYNSRFAGAAAVAEYVRDHFDQLDRVTMQFHETFFDSTLPYELLDTVSSQASIIRTPTCYWTEDGRFYGFEGCNGASTGGWTGTGGCCPTNCSHVFAYEMSLSALFPDLERTMRETELFHQLHPKGYLPHRVTLPLYLPRPWEHPIGGPEQPALDGLLSMVLKTYREHRRCADPEWLGRAWPKIKQAMHYVMTFHDADGDGVIKGEQPNTYDISVYGPNTFIGSLYLAALLASRAMAEQLGEPELAASYRQRYEQARAGYDQLLWGGEYWIQIYDPEQHPEQNYGKGCHSDHLFGQWWAHCLGLGHIFPEERVRTAVQSIVKYNGRENFQGHVQKPRQFVSDDEPGLLICSWPHGGRPQVPTLYSDEIWTGIEYEVAALCIYEGFIDEGLAILRATRSRYNGARRSPWNDIECGDHYIRAMSSWALLDAICGYQYDAAAGRLQIAPKVGDGEFRAFFITDSAWGSVSISIEGDNCILQLKPVWGTLKLKEVVAAHREVAQAEAHLEDRLVDCSLTAADEAAHVSFSEFLQVEAGHQLTIRFAQ
jgi:non-lysosomal glucosylceramidase